MELEKACLSEQWRTSDEYKKDGLPPVAHPLEAHKIKGVERVGLFAYFGENALESKSREELIG